MQKLIIIGNVTRDPEMRVTTAGKNVCTFTVAVNRRRTADGHQDADFFRVNAWEKLGELCHQYLAQGRKVAVSGQVSVNAYKNANGEAQASMNVYAENVEFLSPRQEQQQEQKNTANAVQNKGYVEVENDDLPWS